MIAKLYNRPGVYYLKNKLNGKLYVGSSVYSIRDRVQTHVRDLRKDKHSNRYLQAAWNLYGETAFELGTIAFCKAEDCIVREQFYLDRFKSANRENGYNIREKAESNLGVKVSVEGRRRIALGQMHKRLSDEHIAKVAGGNLGKEMSLEARCKLSIALAGNTNGSGKKGNRYPEAGRKKIDDLTDKEYGRLKVISLYDMKPHARWLCRCKCGKEVVVYGNNLKKPGGTRSCGCILSEHLTQRNKSKEHRYRNRRS